MPNTEIEPKPIVGEDGELLEADQTVDMQVYYNYVGGFYPPPTRLQRFQQFASKYSMNSLRLFLSQ